MRNNLRGTAKDLLKKIEEMDDPIRGEVTLVISGDSLTEKDLEKQSKVNEISRHINIEESVAKLMKHVNLPDRTLRKVMKDSFHLNKNEIKTILDNLRHKEKKK
jgi:16S rRNA C1402 (ribose-2'-O) methylase RsmI